VRQRPSWLPTIGSSSAAVRLGLKYEKQAHEEMTKRYGDRYQSGVWFQYADARGEHYCQLDGLLELDEQYVVLEMKYNHVAAAWTQLRYLYGPVVRSWSDKEVLLVEVVKWFDPDTVSRRPARLLKDVEKARANTFNVHVWRPRSIVMNTPSLDNLWTTEAM
jgi:hypothetical protein